MLKGAVYPKINDTPLGQNRTEFTAPLSPANSDFQVATGEPVAIRAAVVASPVVAAIAERWTLRRQGVRPHKVNLINRYFELWGR